MKRTTTFHFPIKEKEPSIFNVAVIVAALGYFVDIYDLLMFSIIRVPSLRSLGLDDQQIASSGLFIINIQMLGLLIGGFFWGILGDKKGRLKILFASITIYSLGNIANGFVQTVPQYAAVRFFTGLGLAGELGAGITLVSELLPKQKRGIGTSLVAGIGLSGAVLAFCMKQLFDWRTCYFIGGGLGIVLLCLRVGVKESPMYASLKQANVSAGNIAMLFNNWKRFRKYISTILIALPNWFVIGILVTFSKEFSERMNIQGAIDPGKAIMIAYAAIAVGDIAIGLISQKLKSRKKALFIFYGITIVGIAWFFSLNGDSTTAFYAACAVMGLGTGFWAIFVTMAAEQFGTNIRATVATTVPNMARGSLTLVSLVFVGLQSYVGYVNSALVTGVLVVSIALASAAFAEETFDKDLDYLES